MTGLPKLSRKTQGKLDGLELIIPNIEVGQRQVKHSLNHVLCLSSPFNLQAHSYKYSKIIQIFV